jgi:hypothetical protein
MCRISRNDEHASSGGSFDHGARRGTSGFADAAFATVEEELR